METSLPIDANVLAGGGVHPNESGCPLVIGFGEQAENINTIIHIIFSLVISFKNVII